jgi:hypothetical protein
MGHPARIDVVSVGRSLQVDALRKGALARACACAGGIEGDNPLSARQTTSQKYYAHYLPNLLSVHSILLN